jgi:ribonuclease HI
MTKRPAKPSPPSSARLFDESRPAPPAGVHLANIDGASRGNPGPAAYAVILRAPGGAVLCEIAKCIGRETNNVAEYYGLIAALDYSAGHGIRALRVRSDSELLVRQMQGRYRVKHPALKPLFERAQKLARSLDYFAMEHVPREANSDADALANLALDGAGNPTRNPAKSPGESHPSIATGSRRVRVYVRNGKLVPDSPLDLPEGASLDIEFRIPKKT